MSEITIKVENLSKRYRINARAQTKKSLGRLGQLLSSPVQYLVKSLRPPTEEETLWALKDVSFEAKEGEVIGVIGRNGAGKSTLLKVLSRTTAPTTGHIELYGKLVPMLEVGTGFHPDLTGRENIYVNGMLMGMSRRDIDAQFDEIVEFAEIERFIDTPVKYYSSGMYVRLGFSVAAHLRADILLIDEVLSVGDYEFQKKCLGKIQDVSRKGRTVLFVSHNISSVERLCTRGILLQKGSIMIDGPIESVIRHYLGVKVGHPGEISWPQPMIAPGDDTVRLKAARVKNAAGQVVSQIDVTEAVDIEVEYWTLKPDCKLTVGLHFYDEDGDLIFLMLDSQAPDWEQRPRPVGVHRSVCHIPKHFFNEGAISVLLAIATHPYITHVSENDLISFRVTDAFLPGGARGAYTREWLKCAIRPLMDWTLETTPAESPEQLLDSGQRNQ